MRYGSGGPLLRGLGPGELLPRLSVWHAAVGAIAVESCPLRVYRVACVTVLLSCTPPFKGAAVTGSLPVAVGRRRARSLPHALTRASGYTRSRDASISRHSDPTSSRMRLQAAISCAPVNACLPNRRRTPHCYRDDRRKRRPVTSATGPIVRRTPSVRRLGALALVRRKLSACGADTAHSDPAWCSRQSPPWLYAGGRS